MHHLMNFAAKDSRLGALLATQCSATKETGLNALSHSLVSR